MAKKTLSKAERRELEFDRAMAYIASLEEAIDRLTLALWESIDQGGFRRRKLGIRAVPQDTGGGEDDSTTREGAG